MNWRFFIIDRNNIAVLIDEPVGWSDIEIDLSRDADTHGVFFDYQNNDFLFYKRGGKIIKAEHDAYGIRGNLVLLIEYQCAGSTYNELYRGKLIFSKYEYICGDECYAKISIETTSDVMELRSKWDQKVNLQTTLGFDQVTALPTYPALPFTAQLPSKGILLQNSELTTAVLTTPVHGAPGVDLSTHDFIYEYGMLEIPFDNEVAAEIGGVYFNTSPLYDCVQTDRTGIFFVGCDSLNKFALNVTPNNILVAPLDISPVVNYGDGFANFGVVTDNVVIDINVAGTITATNCKINNIFINIALLPDGKDGGVDADYMYLYQHAIFNDPVNFIEIGQTQALDFTYNNPTFRFTKGDRIYMYYSIFHSKTLAQSVAATDAFTVSYNAGNFFKMTTLSHTPATPAKLFMVNEAMSRVAETITNDKIRCYSDYFGRTDSMPYHQADDGPGSLEAITMGLFIRQQENRIAGKPFLFNISLKDIWSGLEPIHHIGMGVEPDGARKGFNCMRIEYWKHFYNTSVVMRCVGVNKITRQLNAAEHYASFSFGYAKWEAEEYNGLDELLTKRDYRTTLDQINTTLSKISTMISSGYAWEVTRRKGATDSSDWRYDNDVFIACCKRLAEAIVIEQGNAINTENILDPASLYNYRISPIRNAMRWIDKIFSGYINPSADDKIIFTDGDGNYLAKGEMAAADNKIEAGPIAEDDDISAAQFADVARATPLLAAERILFDFPMSIYDFKKVKQNLYGLIQYTGCETGYGWIDTVKYKPEEGLASFVLIPTYGTITPPPVDYDYIETEYESPIASENGDYIMPE